MHYLFCAVLATCLALPAYADCFDDAAAWHHVNADILRAIAWQESHNQPAAKHKNANGSVDYGVMQINTIHLATLKQYGIDRDTLMEPCKNVYVAAWHLRQQVNIYGNTWAAVGAYHSATPQLRDQYAGQIEQILVRWQDLPRRARPRPQTMQAQASAPTTQAASQPQQLARQ